MEYQRSWKLAVVMGSLLASVVYAAAQRPARAAGEPAAVLARGKYLTAVLGCGDCHTPHERGRPVEARAFSGHPEGAPLPEWDPSLLQRNIASTTGPTLTAWAGPFGLSVAGNLTPDPETGIGKLTADDLVRSWRTGKHWKQKDRMVLPPMPIAAYRELTDGDIRAVFAYLMSVKPIKNNCPPSKPALAPALK